MLILKIIKRMHFQGPKIYLFGIVLVLLNFVAAIGCKSPEDSGVGSRSCSEAMKLFQACNILNNNESAACKVQWDGVILSCGMM